MKSPGFACISPRPPGRGREKIASVLFREDWAEGVLALGNGVESEKLTRALPPQRPPPRGPASEDSLISSPFMAPVRMSMQ